IVTGGFRFSRLKFNRLAASSSVSTLFLAVVAMVVPTLLAASGGPRYNASLLSEEISAVLIAMYALSLLFGLRTHKGQLAQALPADTLTGQGRAIAVMGQGVSGPTGSPWPQIGLFL